MHDWHNPIMSNGNGCFVHNCRKPAVGTISRYPGEDYCFFHLNALAYMNSKRRPKPVISYFPGFDETQEKVRDSISNEERLSRISSFEEAEKRLLEPKIEPAELPSMPPVEVSIKRSKSAKHRIRNWAFGITVITALIWGIGWNENRQAHLEAVQTLQVRNDYALKCFKISGENEAARAGGVGSPERISAVNSFYETVIKSECVEWGDGTIFKNPFFNASQTSWNWRVLQNAYSYTLERWNGVEGFSLHCADGWSSPSIGRQGACSHHGGVTSGFNELKKWDLTNQFTFSQPIYPSLQTLEDAAAK